MLDLFPDDVQGWLAPIEGNMLAKYARGLEVLELGSFHGRSTICMAQVAAEVHSVDTHAGDIHIGPQDTLTTFLANLVRYGVRDKVVVHVAATQSLLHRFTERSFDFCFVDGTHDFASVQHDARHARRLVRPGGIVAFHDWDRGEVCRGAEVNGFRAPIDAAWSLAVFRLPL